MQALWENGASTVAEVREHLADPLAYTTVLTVLRTLEAKGYVGHEEAGRGHRYLRQPSSSRRRARTPCSTSPKSCSRARPSCCSRIWCPSRSSALGSSTACARCCARTRRQGEAAMIAWMIYASAGCSVLRCCRAECRACGAVAPRRHALGLAGGDDRVAGTTGADQRGDAAPAWHVAVRRHAAADLALRDATSIPMPALLVPLDGCAALWRMPDSGAKWLCSTAGCCCPC